MRLLCFLTALSDPAARQATISMIAGSLPRTSRRRYHLTGGLSTHYETLNLSQSATRQEIKESFYKLSKQFHPDAPTSLASSDKFKKVSEAYAVLSDPARRTAYDRTMLSSRPTHVRVRPGFTTRQSYGAHGAEWGLGARSERWRPTAGFAWMTSQKSDATAWPAFRRRDPFASPGSANATPAWELFSRMAAQEARRAERAAERKKKDEIEEHKMNPGSHAMRLVQFLTMCCFAYIVAYEITHITSPMPIPNTRPTGSEKASRSSLDTG